MAFQAGTPVDPRLLDYSAYAQGMTNAAAINAQSLADLGAKIGDSVNTYYEKKKEKEDKALSVSNISTLIRNNPEFAEALNVIKTKVPSGEFDNAGNELFDLEYDEGAVKTAATTVVDTFGVDMANSLYGMELMQSIQPQEVQTGGGITSATQFKEYVSIDNPNYQFGKDKSGKTIILKRDIDKKFKPVTDPNDEIFMLTDNPKAYFRMYSPSDSQGLYR